MRMNKKGILLLIFFINTLSVNTYCINNVDNNESIDDYPKYLKDNGEEFRGYPRTTTSRPTINGLKRIAGLLNEQNINYNDLAYEIKTLISKTNDQNLKTLLLSLQKKIDEIFEEFSEDVFTYIGYLKAKSSDNDMEKQKINNDLPKMDVKHKMDNEYENMEDNKMSEYLDEMLKTKKEKRLIN